MPEVLVENKLQLALRPERVEEVFIAPELRNLPNPETDYSKETIQSIVNLRQTLKPLGSPMQPPKILNANGQIIETYHFPTTPDNTRQEIAELERRNINSEFRSAQELEKIEQENQLAIDQKTEEGLYKFYNLTIAQRLAFVEQMRKNRGVHNSLEEISNNRILWEATKLDNLQDPNYYKSDLFEHIDQVKWNIQQIINSKSIDKSQQRQLIINEIEKFKSIPEYQKLGEIINYCTTQIGRFNVPVGTKNYTIDLTPGDFVNLQRNIKNKNVGENILESLNLKGLLASSLPKPANSKRYIPSETERRNEMSKSAETNKNNNTSTKTEMLKNAEIARAQKEQISYSEIITTLKSTLEYTILDVIKPKATFEYNSRAIKSEIIRFKNSQIFQRMVKNHGSDMATNSLRKYIKNFMATDYPKRIGFHRNFEEFDTEVNLYELEKLKYKDQESKRKASRNGKIAEIAFMPVEVAISKGINRLSDFFSRNKK